LVSAADKASSAGFWAHFNIVTYYYYYYYYYYYCIAITLARWRRRCSSVGDL